ncbi:DUF4430 domain-containing protein [Patescibacteria group bacterium]|nr:DUF4430 domain-containing protein [Patescibacteria group bacterium]
MKTLKFFVIALIFLTVGFLLGQSYQLPYFSTPEQEVGEDQTLKINYSLQFSDSEMIEFQNIAIQKNETALDVLQKLASANDIALETKDYQDLGIMITKIGEMENGQNNKYWQFFVNGEYAPVGAGQYLLKGGENVEWIFTGDNFSQ